MSVQPDPAAVPQRITCAAQDAAAQLFAALAPDMGAASSPEVHALWRVAKLLAAAAGDLDTPGTPGDEQRRARWEEIAGLAADITDQALTVVADSLDLAQAERRQEHGDVRDQDLADAARAYGGTIALTPPDYEDTVRTLTVTVSAGVHRTLTVTADRGRAPQPRAHTPATLLRTAHHLHQLARVLGEVVLEPEADGIPMCGRPEQEITCGICGSTVGADVARIVDIAKGFPHQLQVCSITCARAAYAGEHDR